MSDLISRRHAIDEIRDYITEPDISDDEIKIEGYNQGLETAISVLSILSSAEPIERTAKVKVLYRDESVIFGHCECGQAVNTYGIYCHKCGARLEWK